VSKRYPAELPHVGTIPLILLQHRRTASSPIHHWISDKIVESIKEWERDIDTD